MKRQVLLGLAAVLTTGWITGAPYAGAQTHAVKKPDTVVRAVAVYEYTGEAGKATASRIVPVSLFINGQLQDAGVYMARPIPFAIQTGNVYETQKAGLADGTLELAYDRHLTAGDTEPIDNGWLAYGPFKPKPAEAPVTPKKSGALPKVEASGGTRPHFGAKPAATTGDDATAKSASDDKDADTARRDDSRPTFHKAPGATADTANNRTVDASDPADEAERPTLKRRTPSEIKADQKKKDSAKVVGGTDLNDDPDRPNLHRGKPASRMEESDIPPLRGTPKDMKQTVAVSDAKTRAEHDFTRPFDSDAERADILTKMQAFAREKLAAYKDAPTAAAPAKPAAPAAHAAAAHAATPTAATAATRPRPRTAKAATPVAASVPLTNETLRGYLLSYGGDPTYVYTASTPGANGSTRYVSLVAQQDAVTGLKVALSSVTDSAHLDRTPWLRLVDVVDADASNRASLLMELRAQHTRQFALYRVIGGEAEQMFLGGTTE